MAPGHCINFYWFIKKQKPRHVLKKNAHVSKIKFQRLQKLIGKKVWKYIYMIISIKTKELILRDAINQMLRFFEHLQ